MPVAEALLDSNVIIAIAVKEHLHHAASIAVVSEARGGRFAIAAHSYAEAFSHLTKRNAAAMFKLPAPIAWRVLESISAETTLVGLTPPQSFAAIRDYASKGGVGPRLYHHLIGRVAVQYGIPRIITWNVGHMRDLFPDLDVCDPVTALG